MSILTLHIFWMKVITFYVKFLVPVRPHSDKLEVSDNFCELKQVKKCHGANSSHKISTEWKKLNVIANMPLKNKSATQSRTKKCFIMSLTVLYKIINSFYAEHKTHGLIRGLEFTSLKLSFYQFCQIKLLFFFFIKCIFSYTKLHHLLKKKFTKQARLF